MISIDYDHPPSDPSSSHQVQHISHDLKVSDSDLKFSDVDLNDINNPLPNFSIRDYVFGIRSKDISCNWPFSPTSLQLCLKHGVKNLLPPFQSIDSLRNNSSLTRYSLENRLTDEKLITSFDGKPTNTQTNTTEKIALFVSVTTKSSASKGDQESQFHLQHQTKLKEQDKPQKPENASSIRTIIKKSRFVTKVNSSVEHATPNSETMPSKVCPVCKIFSSSSNTTLNAHIDQCLTGEGTMKWTENLKVNVVVKHRVKPRKMRLMVDIYKTAPHCTIEELDRRNGTSWATNSSFPTQEFQFQDEEVVEKEEEEPKRTTINPEGANNEGDVYIDTDGTKVRILSVPKAGSSDNHGSRKLLKEVKRSKIIMGKKNNIFKKKHHHKYMKLSPNARNLCSTKPQATSGQEDDVAMNVADLGIIRLPWACSKRTRLSKKSSGKNRKVVLQCRETKDLVFESQKSSLKCNLGTPQSSFDNLDCLQNTKKMKISLSLIKQPNNGMVEFRKEATRMHDDDDNDDDDDDDDECPSQHSDHGADTGSKGSKFPSLSKNLSFPALKINLKRNFSAVERFHVKSVDGSSQDSLQDQSRVEEQAGTTKKEDSRSITSKSSNGDSSVGIQTVNQDDFHDGESLSNVPSFMGLSTSFDPDFSKQECDEMYKDQICLTNRASNDVEIRESYCHEVDLIPIPGPPGSFLPASPGGEMISEEEIQAVTVLPSSENQYHHDHTMDRDSMSNSPVSTVSNSRSTSVQDDTCKRPFFIGHVRFTEKSLSHNSFKNDYQPCCCSRKEVASNFQDSYILGKQAIESNRSIPGGFNFKSEMFSPATEIVSFPTNKKFAVSSDCDSRADSPSKPVLRLMGKNLTVVKTDEDEFRAPPLSQPHPQQNIIFSQYQNGFQSQHFNVHPPINRRSHVDLMPIHGSFMGSDHYGHGSPYLGPTMPQTRSHHGRKVLDFQTISGRNVYNAASSSDPIKEVIIIDDSPESEADYSMQNEFFKRSRGEMNPSYTIYPSNGGGSSVFRGSSIQTSLGNIGDLGKWNIGSPSMSHMRSSTSYYP